MSSQIYDLVVIGGGINGVGIAVDAQGRGLHTALIEKDDLASGTSSASSKLIHGGLRYLEHLEFRLVTESLRERSNLLASAPHLVRPMEFILPVGRETRPAWMVRLGLRIYDLLAIGGRLPASRSLRFDPDASPLKPAFSRGFQYSDCQVDDSRLVVTNAVRCRELGGEIWTRTECLRIERDHGAGHWRIHLENRVSGEQWSIAARGVVNAAGPWVNTITSPDLSASHHRSVRLVRGSHIVLPRICPGEKAYLLQNDDGRVVFALPFLSDFTLVGTTDVEHHQSADEVTPSVEEISYLCDAVNRYFRKPVSPDQVVWNYSGVRALLDHGESRPQSISRDYSLVISAEQSSPFLTVYGGKLTTYRALAEKAVDKLSRHYPQAAPAWTAAAALPGGDLGMAPGAYAETLRAEYQFLSLETSRRLTAAYGTRARHFLGSARRAADLGEDFGRQFTEAELGYLLDNEWALSADDVLWRRTKLGLFLNERQQRRIAAYIKEATG